MFQMILKPKSGSYMNTDDNNKITSSNDYYLNRFFRHIRKLTYEIILSEY